MTSRTLHFGLAEIVAVSAIVAAGCSSDGGGGVCASDACDASLDSPPIGDAADAVSDDDAAAEAGDARDAADAAEAADVADTLDVADVPSCAEVGCTGGATCCGDRCVDPATDPGGCGACGTVCTGSFCAASHCRTVAFANLLANTRVAVVSDGQSDDNAAAQTLSLALTARGLTARTSTQDLAGDLLGADGRPHPAAGETFIAVGGPFQHRAVQWLEANVAPLALETSATGWGWMNRVPRTAVAERPGAWFDAQHDLFVVQLVFDPGTTRLSCEAYGYTGKGTLAAVYYFVHTLLPNKDAYPATSWMVVEWVDVDGDGVASAGDSYTPLASG
jgi:hypothetical protein